MASKSSRVGKQGGSKRKGGVGSTDLNFAKLQYSAWYRVLMQCALSLEIKAGVAEYIQDQGR
jgi:hypothetical protein